MATTPKEQTFDASGTFIGDLAKHYGNSSPTPMTGNVPTAPSGYSFNSQSGLMTPKSPIGGAVMEDGTVTQNGSTPISTSVLEGAKTFNVPQVKSTEAQTNLGMKVAAGTPSPTVETKPQSEVDKMRSLLAEQGTEADYRAQVQQEAGLEQARLANQAIDKEAADTTLKYNAEIEKLKQNRGGMIGEAFDARVSQLESKKNQELANIAIRKSVAQGDVNTALSLVKDKVDAKFEPIKNQIETLKAQYSMVQNDMSESEKMKAQEVINSQQRNYELAKARETRLGELDIKASDLGIKGQGLLDVMRAETIDEKLLAIARNKPAAASTSNAQIDNERSLLAQFNSQPIVKDYNEVVANKLKIDNIIKNGVGGPADLALVFAFMKALDPNSVVRETEYATAAKSGNIFAGAFAKYNGYLKEKGGMLPKSVQDEFQNLANQFVESRQAQYDNIKSGYESIAERQGLDPRNVTLDLSNALKTKEGKAQIEASGMAQMVLPDGRVLTLQKDGTYK